MSSDSGDYTLAAGPRVISLFSGIGGFDLAFERAGCTVVAQVESDPQCRAVLAEHWPNVPRFDDVCTFQGDDDGTVDVIVGGFPCQDVSVAGRRAGLAGKRSGLWWQFRRIVRRHRPRWVVIENVPGLLSSNAGRDFAVIVRGLVRCGYRVAWRVLDAQYFGLAQRRRRVFIVGSLGDGSCAEILFESEGLLGHPQPGGEAGETVAYALAAGAGGSKFESGRQGQDTLIAKPLGAHDGRLDLDNDTYVVDALQSHSKRHGHAMTTQQAAESNQIIAFESRFACNGRGAPSEIVPPLKAQSGQGDGAPLVAFAWQNSAARGMAPTSAVPTLETDKSHAINHPSGPRRLTPTECERLQGFPDNFTASQSDGARYRMLGNAVAVPVVEWIARRIIIPTDKEQSR